MRKIERTEVSWVVSWKDIRKAMNIPEDAVVDLIVAGVSVKGDPISIGYSFQKVTELSEPAVAVSAQEDPK